MMALSNEVDDTVYFVDDWRGSDGLVMNGKDRNLYLLSTGHLADVKFHLMNDDSEGEEPQCVPAHSFVLMSASPMFEGLLYYRNLREVDVYETEKSIFMEMLRYIYIDECVVTPSNALLLFQAAYDYQVKPLMYDCLRFACKNADLIIMDQSFLRVSKATLELFMASEQMFVYEYDLFLGMLLWARNLTNQLQALPLKDDEFPLSHCDSSLQTGCGLVRRSDFPPMLEPNVHTSTVTYCGPVDQGMLRGCETYDPYCDVHGFKTAQKVQNGCCSCPFTDMEDLIVEPPIASQTYTLQEICHGADKSELRKTLQNLIYMTRYPNLKLSEWGQVSRSELLLYPEVHAVGQVRVGSRISGPAGWPRTELRLWSSTDCSEFFPLNAEQPGAHVSDSMKFSVRYRGVGVIEGFTIWSDCIQRVYYKYNDHPVHVMPRNHGNRWKRVLHKTVEIPNTNQQQWKVVLQDHLNVGGEIQFTFFFSSSFEAFFVEESQSVPQGSYKNCTQFAISEMAPESVIIGTPGICPIRSLFMKI